jgi:hypothetical protein
MSPRTGGQVREVPPRTHLPTSLHLSINSRVYGPIGEVLVLAAARRGSPPEMNYAELRIDARTVDDPGPDSRWNCDGYALSV